MAVIGYWIDKNFTMNEKLLICHPFSEFDHTGENIKDITLQGLVAVGVADDKNDIWNHVHGCTPDEGSNMLSAWKIFEGAGCVCHRANNCLVRALQDDCISLMVLKVKSICLHFYRSVKVSRALYAF